jgi:hypothetical protein
MLIEFGIPMKVFRLIKMYLNETYIKVNMGKNLSDIFPIQNGINHCYSIYASKYAITRVEENQVGLKLNGTLHLLAYADDVNLFGDYIETVK